MTENAPRRRVRMKIEIGADSWDDLGHMLGDIGTRILMGEMRSGGVSGGYSSGFTWEADEDDSVTHDSYVADLDDYLEDDRLSTTDEPAGADDD